MRTVDYAKVAQAVDCCVKCSADACNHCPYITEGCDEPDVKLVRVPVFLLKDVGEVLKEQKAVEPGIVIERMWTNGAEIKAYCGACKGRMIVKDRFTSMEEVKEQYRFCHHCGQAVKWE